MEDLDGKAERLVKYTNAGLLIPDIIIRNDIRFREELPPEPKGAESQVPQQPQDPPQQVTMRKTVIELSDRVQRLTEMTYQLAQESKGTLEYLKRNGMPVYPKR